jgi:hypothetical protein
MQGLMPALTSCGARAGGTVVGRAREELKRRLLALEDMLHRVSGQNYNTPPSGRGRGGGAGAGAASENGDIDGAPQR